MDFSEYQEWTLGVDRYPRTATRYTFLALGLAEEAGEVVGKIKKAIRDDDGVITSERREAIKKELGDTLWYLSRLASECDITVQEVIDANVEKLTSRRERGTLQGSGDDR